MSETNLTHSHTVNKPVAVFLIAIALYLCSSALIADSVKIAFIGDQGVSSGAQQVLELIRDEGSDFVLIQGDLGYARDAASQWITNMDTILGDDMPVLFVVGNHENFEWPTYLQWQKQRLAKTPDIVCEGDIAVKSYCSYKDFGFVFVAPAINEVDGVNGNDDYAQYIDDTLSNDNSIWRFCSWHKNMRDMQPGGKGDATGWGVYQSCLAQGGIVLNGHEHSYSRTHLMSSFEAKQVIHTDSDMTIGPGSSIVLLTGLGGREVRPQQHGGDWFASIYTSNQNASVGALFCDFDGSAASCYFKDIAGKVPDVFTLRSASATAGTQSEQQALVDIEMPLDEEPADTIAAVENEPASIAQSADDAVDLTDQLPEPVGQEANSEETIDSNAAVETQTGTTESAVAEEPETVDAETEAEVAVEPEVIIETETESVVTASPETVIEAAPQAVIEPEAIVTEPAMQSESLVQTEERSDTQAEPSILPDTADPVESDEQTESATSSQVPDAQTITSADSMSTAIPTDSLNNQNTLVVNNSLTSLILENSLDDSVLVDTDSDIASANTATSARAGGGSPGWIALLGLTFVFSIRRFRSN